MARITLKLLAAAILLTALPAIAAESTERTYMPDRCSDRDQNCVKDDGPPPRDPWVRRRPPNNGNNGGTGNNGSGANSKNNGTAWASGTAAPRTK